MIPETHFRSLNVGDTFDFISPDHMMNSFSLRCTKISPRKYRDEDGVEHRVFSTYCTVYNVERNAEKVG